MSRKFIDKDFFLNSDNKEKDYKKNEEIIHPYVYWGQRKLLISEIQFLSIFWDKNIPNPIILYIGAAHGIHINLLIDFFPKFEYHLYDELEINVTSSNKVFIHNKLFTSEDAKYWSTKNNIYLISDIRNTTNNNYTEEFEKGVMDDMQLQKEWVDIIKPVFSHLKFRISYTEECFSSLFNYFSGYLFIQPYTKESSGEIRLVTDGKKTMSWDMKKIERQMAYHNKIVRGDNIFLNPFTDDLTSIDDKELLNDYDSLVETNIIILYCKRIINIEPTKEDIVQISRAITDFFHQEKNDKNKASLYETLEYNRNNPKNRLDKLSEIRKNKSTK